MINGKTKVLGVIGDPIEHTFSPAMHNAGLKYLNLNYKYIPFHVSNKDSNNLPQAILGAKALDFVGLNVTIPHKIPILDCLDKIDDVSAMIGAVNTVKFEEDENSNKITIGYNTDGYGAVRAIKDLTDISNKKVVITGAGGASRAIAFEIANSNISELSILNRNYKKAENLVNDLNSNLDKFKSNVEINSYELDDLDKELSQADIFIDTTPIGMFPNVDDKAIATKEIMHEDLVVNDIVYTPKETSLLKEAEKAGCLTVPGYKMLLYQGIRSFEIWLEQEAPVEVMENALLKVLGI